MLEVIVVIAVIATLLALLLSAVLRARATARRMQCQSNLRQIGLAMANYEATHGVFPEGDTGNWGLQLLPYLEQSAASVEIQYITAHEILKQEVGYFRAYICVDDPEVDQYNGFYPSYRINAGSRTQQCRCCDGIARSCRDVGDFGNPISAADVTDGLSQTAAFSEKLIEARPESGDAYEYPEYWIRWFREIPIPRTQPQERDLFSIECEQNALPMGAVWSGIGSNMTDRMSGPSYNHVVPPNRNSCWNGDDSRYPGIAFRAETATSLHEGYVNVLMADGAVKPANDSIDREVWSALGSRDGGETESNDF